MVYRFFFVLMKKREGFGLESSQDLTLPLYPRLTYSVKTPQSLRLHVFIGTIGRFSRKCRLMWIKEALIQEVAPLLIKALCLKSEKIAFQDSIHLDVGKPKIIKL